MVKIDADVVHVPRDAPFVFVTVKVTQADAKTLTPGKRVKLEVEDVIG